MKKFILLLGLIFVFVGCASIVKGNMQLITINSNVDGAEVLLDGVSVGQTPFTGEVSKKGKVLLVKKEGYKDYNIALSKNLEPWFWGNIITGGTFGSITDFASGAAWAYGPSSYQVELIENGMGMLEFEENVKLKKFAMINMSSISIDLANGGGAHLNALFELAKLEKNDVSANLIREYVVQASGDQIRFGQLIVGILNS
ncbi:MAG: PEGA domain-containing protein [Calditrichia bacterium]